MAAGHYGLDNLVAIIDRNRLQISGDTERIMRLDSLTERYHALGWYIEETDGNNMEDLVNIFRKLPVEAMKPHLVIANTTKGKGISFIENQAGWHHKVPTKEQLDEALLQLDEQLKKMSPYES